MSAKVVKIFAKDKALFERLKGLPREALLKTSVHTVPFCTRALNTFDRVGISTLDELSQRHRFDLLKMRNLGRTSVAQIELYLKELGLSLGRQPEFNAASSEWLDEIVSAIKTKESEATTEKEKSARLAALLEQSAALLAEIKEALQ